MKLEKTLETCKKILIYSDISSVDSEVFQSSIDSVISDSELLILATTSKDGYFKLDPKSVYDSVFFCEAHPYSAKIQLVRYVIKNGIRLAQIKLNSDLARIQRRESFRLETTDLNINFSVISKDDLKSSSNIIEDTKLKFEHKGIVKDISEGGIKFNCNEELDIDTIINISLKIQEYSFITKGKVLNFEFQEHEKFKNSYKVSFQDLSIDNKKFLQKYIFDEQLKARRK